MAELEREFQKKKNLESQISNRIAIGIHNISREAMDNRGDLLMRF